MHRQRLVQFILSGCIFAATLALLSLTRRAPRDWGFVWFDAASALHLVVLAGGVWLGVLAHPTERHIPLRVWIALALCAVAALLPFSAVIAGAYLLLAILLWQPAVTAARRLSIHLLGGIAAGGGMALGYGLLAVRGAVRVDDPLAGAALDSLVFAAILAGTAGALLLPDAPQPASLRVYAALLRVIWLLPLMRLYTLGPWNEGWSLATMLLAGLALVHASSSALSAADEAERHLHGLRAYRALALAGVGLSTGGGIAVAGYALLVAAVWSALLETSSGGQSLADRHAPTGNRLMEWVRNGWQRVAASADALAPWLASPVFPLSGAFIAFWMLLGAATAGGVAMLGAVVWVAALLLAVALILPGRGRAAALPSIAMLFLGIGAPLVLRLAVQPLVEQLQSGLTVYGDMNVWPWVGLTMIDSARRQVLTWPALAVAALMLVISALALWLRRVPQVFGKADADVSAARSAEQVWNDLRVLLPFGRVQTSEHAPADEEPARERH